MQFIPPDVLAQLQEEESDGATISGVEQMYSDWVERSETQESRTHPIKESYAPSSYFWLALQFPKGDYADKIEPHPEHEILVPAKGTPIKILGVFIGRDALDKAIAKDKNHVHLVYKLRLSDGVSTYRFLEFMISNNLMEKV